MAKPHESRLVPGDEVGPEVAGSARRVLSAVGEMSPTAGFACPDVDVEAGNTLPAKVNASAFTADGGRGPVFRHRAAGETRPAVASDVVGQAVYALLARHATARTGDLGGSASTAAMTDAILTATRERNTSPASSRVL
jgi:isocitrate/isopropylmalate dehydrogenase